MEINVCYPGNILTFCTHTSLRINIDQCVRKCLPVWCTHKASLLKIRGLLLPIVNTWSLPDVLMPAKVVHHPGHRPLISLRQTAVNLHKKADKSPDNHQVSPLYILSPIYTYKSTYHTQSYMPLFWCFNMSKYGYVACQQGIITVCPHLWHSENCWTCICIYRPLYIIVSLYFRYSESPRTCLSPVCHSSYSVSLILRQPLDLHVTSVLYYRYSGNPRACLSHL